MEYITDTNFGTMTEDIADIVPDTLAYYRFPLDKTTGKYFALVGKESEYAPNFRDYHMTIIGLFLLCIILGYHVVNT